MTETPTPTPAPPTPDPQPGPPEPVPVPTGEDEARIPRERLNQEAKKRRDAEKRVEELQAALEERENAGLPELDRMRKDLERAQKRADEADQRAQEAEQRIQRTTKERWIIAAARDFADPADAAAFVNLDDIEDERDAERAVKSLAKQKPHLLKAEEPKLPGRVLQNGQAPAQAMPADPYEAQRQAEGQIIYEGIKNLTRNWQSGGPL